MLPLIVCCVLYKIYSTEPEITQVLRHQFCLKAKMVKSDSADDSKKLVYDGSKQGWSNFRQEIVVYAMRSVVMTALIDGEAVEIRDQDGPNDFERFFKHGCSKAAAEALLRVIVTRILKTIKQALVRDDKIKLYQWLFKHTKNEAKDLVVSKGTAKIEQIMGGIQT